MDFVFPLFDKGPQGFIIQQNIKALSNADQFVLRFKTVTVSFGVSQ